MCAIFDNASLYTRSKFSNNHRLYGDTMPLNTSLKITLSRHSGSTNGSKLVVAAYTDSVVLGGLLVWQCGQVSLFSGD